MINEATFRSPKWMRKFMDFELKTGKDVKGDDKEKQNDKSKKEEESTEQERKKREERESQERRWNEHIKNLERERRERQEREERERQERYSKQNNQESLAKEINDIYFRFLKETIGYNFEDKYKTDTQNQNTIFTFIFENKDVIKLYIYGDKKTLVFTDKEYTTTYTISKDLWNKFVETANEGIRKSRTRPSGYGGSGSSSSNSGGSSSSSYTSSSSTKKNADHPKRGMYDTLKRTVKLREEQLSKMKTTDPEYTSLKNELETARTAMNNLKSKYQFENLKSFTDYLS